MALVQRQEPNLDRLDDGHPERCATNVSRPKTAVLTPEARA